MNDIDYFVPKYVLKWDDNQPEGEIKSIGRELITNSILLLNKSPDTVAGEQSVATVKKLLKK